MKINNVIDPVLSQKPAMQFQLESVCADCLFVVGPDELWSLPTSPRIPALFVTHRIWSRFAKERSTANIGAIDPASSGEVERNFE